MKNTFKILKYSLPYLNLIMLNTLFNVLSVIFSLLSISLIIPILGLLFGTIENPENSVSELSLENLKDYLYSYIYTIIEKKGVVNALAFICVLVAGGTVMKNITRYLALYFLTPIRNNVIKDIRKQLYSKILKLPLKFIHQFKKGDIVARMTTDLTEIEWSIMGVLEFFIKDPVHILLFLISLLYISPELTIIALIFLPFTSFIITQISKSLKDSSLLSQNKIGELISTIEESISNLKIIKGLNAYEIISKNFNAHNQNLKNINNKVLWKKDLASPFSEMLSTLVMVVIIWVGGSIVLKSNLSPDSFIGFLVIFSQIIPPAKSLTTAFYSIQKGAASADRVFEILEFKNEETKLLNQNFDHNISFTNISFKYANDIALKNINLTIRKGEKVVIVGESGSGKSTLVELLLKFYDPLSGEILIDNNNINRINIKPLFTLITQNVMLFNDTIINNLNVGNENASMEEIKYATKQAYISSVIEKLPNKYETIIGAQGNNLSGGERQRIAIARALLSKAPILIFDEPTSSLDSESNNSIQETFNALKSDKTIIMITHKLQFLEEYDRIIVMKNGEIVEQGKHQFLLNKDGVYKKLYEIENSNEKN
tara:strand:- start:712 stop:2511 length:1800 start_codon:yes stop_codon:yes gene_type:complete